MNHPNALWIDLVVRKRGAVSLPRLRPLLRGAAALAGARRGEWTVTLISDRTMPALHARTMNMPWTTDVLTFDLREAGGRKQEARSKKGVVDLDTVISVNEAARRARDLGHGVTEEVLLYALHSLLHVLGYDDQTPAQARRMHRREDAILVRLGVGPVYAGGGKRGLGVKGSHR